MRVIEEATKEAENGLAGDEEGASWPLTGAHDGLASVGGNRLLILRHSIKSKKETQKMSKVASTDKADFQRGDIVQVENWEGLHPQKYVVVEYAGHGFWKVRPGKKGSLSLDLPQAWLVYA